MKSSSKKKKQGYLLRSKFSLLGGIIILAFLGLNFTNTWKQSRAIDLEMKSLEQEIVTLEETNIELSELINYLNSTAYIEKKAREDLGLKKEGEETVIIPSVEGFIVSDDNKKGNDNKASKINPAKWWNYFFES